MDLLIECFLNVLMAGGSTFIEIVFLSIKKVSSRWRALIIMIDGYVDDEVAN